MTKWEFQQIVERDLAFQQRKEGKDCVGLNWLKPILEIEAEEDRHKLIQFVYKLVKKLKTL